MISIEKLSSCGQQVARQSDLFNNYIMVLPSRMGFRSPRIYIPSLVNEPIEKLADSIGTYLSVHQVNIKALERPISSTVLITSDKSPGYDATGIVVKFNGKKYLLTSYHVIIDKLTEAIPDIYGMNTSSGLKEIIPLDEKLLLGFVKPPYGDAAVMKYEGNIEGVDLAKLIEPDCEHRSFSIGYPGCFKQHYLGPQINPMISYGLAVIEEENPDLELEDDYSLPLPPKYEYANIPIPLGWIFYSGVASTGNSGGGLFNVDGELMGIHFGSKRFTKSVSQDDEMYTGTTVQPAIFFSVRELLLELLLSNKI